MSADAEATDLVTEGRASARLPAGVFYNPVQEFNRDLTIVAISEYGRLLREEKAAKRTKKSKKPDCNADEQDEVKERVAGKHYEDGLKILEGLAASGLRSVRFAKEVPGVSQIIANDYSHDAVKTMKENVTLNDVEHLMSTSCDDASMLLYRAAREKGTNGLFDVIDLDPYGGPTQFLDGAVQAVKDGGLLCITCTDMAILCGNASEKCFAAYGAMSLKSKCCHEIALRIVLRTIDSYANRYAKYIVPLLSVSVDYYCRVFVRVYSSAQGAKESASKSAMLYECTGCYSHHLQPLGRVIESDAGNGRVKKKFTFSQGPVVDKHCQHCLQVHHIGGPLWSAPIHNRDFVAGVINRLQGDEVFGTAKRIEGMMNLVMEELEDVPLYYMPDALCGVIHTTSPGFLPFRSAILNAGYRVSLSHAAINSVKTDAPPSVLWDIMRCWAQRHPVNEKRITEGSPCAALLSKKPSLEANFEIHEDAEPESKRKGLLRFQNNKKDWGPKTRGSNSCDAQNEKRKLNQNKRQSKRRKKMDIDLDHYKQYHCASYKRTGACSYGDSCRYSHDIPVDIREQVAGNGEQAETS